MAISLRPNKTGILGRLLNTTGQNPCGPDLHTSLGIPKLCESFQEAKQDPQRPLSRVPILAARRFLAQTSTTILVQTPQECPGKATVRIGTGDL
eukprot:scaffold846_cov168-Amphora_coffeaeformis.AAC.24